MNISWADLELFLAVAEERTLSGAARRLGVSQPTVSRKLSSLEASVASPLFQKTSEGATLTERGRLLLTEVKKMAHAADEGALALRSQDDALRACVRVGIAPGLAPVVVPTLAAKMKRELPTARLYVHTDPGPEHLSEDTAQVLCLPVGHLPQGVRERSRVAVEYALFASKEYQKASVCRSPAEVDFISSSLHVSDGEPLAALKGTGPLPVVFASPDVSLQMGALRAGLGAMLLPVGTDLSPTKLVRLEVGLLKITQIFSVAALDNAHVKLAEQAADLLALVLKLDPSSP